MIKFVESLEVNKTETKMSPFFHFGMDGSFALRIRRDDGEWWNILRVKPDGTSELSPGIGSSFGLKLDSENRLACYPGSEGK